jgi:hypothetical protein
MAEVAAQFKARGELRPGFVTHPLLYFLIKPTYVSISWLYPVLIVGAVTGIPWLHKLRWRFSLRTLLIATTLVALVLGLIVYAVR